MKRLVAPVLLLTLGILPLAPLPLAAQERAVREAGLPAGLEERLLRMYGPEGATRYSGEVDVAPDAEILGDVAATGGPLRVEGRVDGDVAMLGGDVFIGAGGSVTGDVVVVGGALHLADGARVGGEMVEFSAPSVRSRHAGRRDGGDRDDGWWAPGRWGPDYGRSDGFSLITLRTGPGYNRVEGLPLHFGPAIRTRGPHALHLEALGIWRTGADPSLGTDRWGYLVKLTQYLGDDEGIRLGGSAFSVVEPLDRWQMSDPEAFLSAVGLHRDFRDHLGREGWSVFLGMRPLPELDVELEYRDAEHRSLAAADPWTLFGGSRAWRLQPLVGEGELRSLAGTVELDLRDDREDPFTGWFARLRVERAVDGGLTRPALLSAFPETEDGLVEAPLLPGEVPSEELSTDFTTFLVDVRRYVPVDRRSQLNLRVVGGGGVAAARLPSQFQHALGGPGTLPGFPTFHVDCGARAGAGTRDGVPFYPAYGCDRFVLGQVEFRGRISLDLGLGDHDPDDEERDWHDLDVDLDPRWLVFANASRGWAYDRASPGSSVTTGMLYDAGAGLLFHDVGAYFAVPLNGDVERDLRFFVRLQRRF